MISLQALKEYNDNIKALCSAMDLDSISFFTAMEKASINFYNDTEEHKYTSLNYLFSHLNWMTELYQFLVQNRPVEYDQELWESVPDSFQMSPQELFDTLISRSAKTREEILKLFCPQSVITRLLIALGNADLSEFLQAFETNKVDMTNVSKLLSLSNFSQMPSMEDDDDIHCMWMEYVYELNRHLNNYAEMQIPTEIYEKIKIKRLNWLYNGVLSEDEFNDAGWLQSIYDNTKALHQTLKYPEKCSDEEYINNFATLWDLYAKSIILELSKLSSVVVKRIRQTFSPYYLCPVIDKFEKEFNDILKEEKILIKQYKENGKIEPVMGFSLPDDFFAQKISDGSKYMSLRDEIKREGVQKFEKLLIALSEYGYIDYETLPVLAYRLTGFGNDPGEAKIVWHKDPKIIRHIIARMHDSGNYVSYMNECFVDESGETFLYAITADVARNIKSDPFYKEILYPLYGNLVK